MGDALCHRLAKESDMDQREMVDFISDKFDEEVSVTTIARTLNRRKMTQKVMRRIAEQQKPDLQDFYYYRLKMLGCRSYHLVFIDESGIDRPGTFRRKGWAPKGITPVQKARFQRGTRVQFIAAYTQKGLKLSRFFTGSMDKPTFEDFIEQLLCHCGKWPEPETVLIMDNVGFHYSDKVRRMCADVGVKWDFTPPYTPRTDPIEEFFGEVKTYMKSQRKGYRRLIQRDFEAYVKSCVRAVGSRQESAEGHFRNAGLYIEQPPEKFP
jgi:transposase